MSRERRDPWARVATGPRSASARVEPELPVHRIDAPKRLVLAAVAIASSDISDHECEVLGAARLIAGPDGAVCALSAADPTALAKAGADRLVKFTLSEAHFDADACAATLVSVMDQLSADTLVMAATPREEDVALRVAARRGNPPATGVCAIAEGKLVRLDPSRQVEFIGEPAGVVTIAAHTFDPVAGAIHEARPITVEQPPVHPSRVTSVGEIAVDCASIPLEEAPFILGAGNGIKDWDLFLQVAKRLGAAHAGTRVVCDAGHLPRDRQVGASGTIVDANCYAAFGLSGAIQHLQGIETCKHVVAINSDPQAPIVKRADLAIIGDANSILREVAARLS